MALSTAPARVLILIVVSPLVMLELIALASAAPLPEGWTLSTGPLPRSGCPCALARARL